MENFILVRNKFGKLHLVRNAFIFKAQHSKLQPSH
jgi:hypothetical protein